MKKVWQKRLIKENMQRSINNKNKQMAHQLKKICVWSLDHYQLGKYNLRSQWNVISYEKDWKMAIIQGWLALEKQTPQCITNSSLYHVAVLGRDCGFLIS